jgi:ferredoxin
MPSLNINGKDYNAIVNETILSVPRRLEPGQCHIGYACGGDGLCQTCEVTVLEGADALSELSTVETAWLTHAKLQEGKRLGCQARIVKDKPVKVVTRPEIAKTMFEDIFSPSSDKTAIRAAVEFAGYVASETVTHLVGAVPAYVDAARRAYDGRLTSDVIPDAVQAFNEGLVSVLTSENIKTATENASKAAKTAADKASAFIQKVAAAATPPKPKA